MTYNMTFTEEPGISGLFNGINANTGSVFGGILLAAIFLIILIGLREQDFKNSILAASFVTSLIGGAFFFLEWIPGWIAAICVVLLMVSILVNVWTK